MRRSMKYEPIYTEKTGCRDCYKCVRACPVKAIQVKQGSAVVIHDRCIFCGKCVDACPVQAKKIRNDVPKAKRLIIDKKSVYVSLAPSYASEFPGLEQELLEALHRLGFAGVSETALGAEIVTTEINAMLAEGRVLPLISTACPTVVEAVCKYHPELSPLLTQLRSPLGAHSLMLRELYGEDIGLVFIGPCVSKKLEADRSAGLPDVVLTFRELREWMRDRGLDLQKPETLRSGFSDCSFDPASSWYGIQEEKPAVHADFIPRTAGRTSNYALENGMISTLDAGDAALQDTAAGISGVHEVLESLTGIQSAVSSGTSLPSFFELLSCRGGCISGPGCVSTSAHLIKKAISSRHVRIRTEKEQMNCNSGREVIQRSISQVFEPFSGNASIRSVSAGFEIEQALKKLGKAEEQERLDCGGCGYSSCREFTGAFLAGMAEPEMCVTKMRKQAQSKVDMLLRTLPMGVVIVDHGYRIVDCNAKFLKMFSSVSYEAGERELSRVSSLHIDRFIKLQGYFSGIFSGKRAVNQCTVMYEQRIIAATFFPIDENRLAGALLKDITAETMHRDAVKKRAEEVIQKNLQSVQQIASLLGENAAETEIMLSSLIDVFDHTADEG